MSSTTAVALLASVVSIAGLIDRPARGEPAHESRRDLRFITVDTEFLLNAIVQDRDGLWWLATQNGLVKYTGYDSQHYEAGPDSTTGNFVTALHQDSHGVLWIGTTSGVSSYDKRTDTFTQYRHDPDDPTSIGSDIIPMFNFQWVAEDDAGGVFFATHGGLNRLDRKTGRFSRYPSDRADPGALIDSATSAILRDTRGFLWIGTAHGLHKFDPATGAVVQRFISDDGDPDALHGKYVSAIVEDTRGRIWIGTRDAGLSRLDPARGVFTHYAANRDLATGLCNNFVSSIVEDAGGRAGTRTGRSGRPRDLDWR